MNFKSIFPASRPDRCFNLLNHIARFFLPLSLSFTSVLIVVIILHYLLQWLYIFHLVFSCFFFPLCFVRRRVDLLQHSTELTGSMMVMIHFFLVSCKQWGGGDGGCFERRETQAMTVEKYSGFIF